MASILLVISVTKWCLAVNTFFLILFLCHIMYLGTEKDLFCLAQAFVLSLILVFPWNSTGFCIPYVLYHLLNLCQPQIYSLIWFLSLLNVGFFFGSLPNTGLHSIIANKGQLNYMKSSYQQTIKRIFTQLCYNNVAVNMHNYVYKILVCH